MRKRIPISDLLFEYDERLGNSEEPVVLSLTEKNGFVPQTERFNKRLATNDSTNYKIVRRFDLAYNQYLLWAGAIAQNKNWDVGIVSPAYPTFRVHYGFDPRYVEWLLTGDPIRLRYDAISFGAVPRRRRAKVSDFLSIAVPEPPPISEQKRIAGILDAADALRAKRREALAQLDTLLQSTFLDMFGDPVTNPMGWDNGTSLGQAADIVSGLTKGRKLKNKKTREVPYLAVVNVQDRHLVLEPLKHIQATEDEIQRFQLKPNDLLLTEGGDPDKLGRGTLWSGQIKECIHQNHIFRVRLSEKRLVPMFLNWLISSNYGKLYFLDKAKQTTGIASINLTQLRSFPLLIPPFSLQRRFATIVESVERQKATMRAHLAELDTLFASLQSRAFNGEL